MQYVELRDRNGEFLGMCDVAGFPSDLSSILLPVSRPFKAVWNPDEALSLSVLDVIEVEFAEWMELGSRRNLLRLRSGEPEWLAHVRRVHVYGATCRTKYGEAVEFMELLVRLYHLVKFHKMPVCRATIH